MFKAWLDNDHELKDFLFEAYAHRYKWSDGKPVNSERVSILFTPSFVVVRDGVVTWGVFREEYESIDLPDVVERIRDAVPLPARYEQLAEECAECAKEALKLARYLRGENPTPDRLSSIERRLCDEIGDIKNVLAVVRDLDAVEGDRKKMFRWCMRLEGDEH